MELTQNELNILAHVVIEPTAWVSHALETQGEEAVKAKIEKYKPIYESALAEQGSDYKNRKQTEEAQALDIATLKGQ
jgi:hypothetical protein